MDAPVVSEQEIKEIISDQIDPEDRSVLAVKVRENYDEIIQAMIEAAKGIWRKHSVVRNGIYVEVPVYQEKPNTEVAQYLLNQLIGKPKETQAPLGIQNNIVIQWRK